MGKYQTLIYKFLLLAGVLFCFNFIYKKLFYEKDLQKHSPIINNIRKVIDEKNEIIYLGESSNTTFKEDDIDKRPISDMISDYYPSRNFGNINKEASHAGIYYTYLNAIPENSNIKTVIVTLNLRSFDASWIHSNLETALLKSLVLIKDYPPLFNRLMLSFKGYDIKSDKEREIQVKESWSKSKLKFEHPFPYDNVTDWDFAMASKGVINEDGSRNEEATILACHYIKTYAFQIDTTKNPRIKDFDNIVSLAKKRNWNLVFNLMAENVDKAESLVGNELVYFIKQNRDLLVSRYSNENVTVVDNLSLINNDEFIDQNWTTEHYSESGRRLIAKNVANALKRFYPNDYKEFVSESKKIYSFYNDCEGKIEWGQMQTLTDEIAYSGKMSSKTGQKNDFSISFNSYVKNLPDSLKSLSLSFQKFQRELNMDAKIVVEISGSRIKYQWNGFIINEIAKSTNKWELVKLDFTLPVDFNSASVVKIYVFNPTEKLMFIDDMNIHFK